MSTPLPPLKLPEGKKKLLLHSCCAPCSVAVIEALCESSIDFSIYFYNPNIHPEKEYILRKEENIRYAQQMNIPFIDADYDKDRWFEKAQGMEDEPERGIRCTMCFDMRFLHTAQYAAAHDFDIISSSLGISRWKNMDQINQSGLQAVKDFPSLIYWTYNWRKMGGSKRMIDLSKENRFYQQQYCGCVYSLRDSNRWRLKNNRPRIRLGDDYYEK